jgi:hypothetical protein
VKKYEIIVGNIGFVYETNNPIDARHVYGQYKRQSLSGIGRAGGESVTLTMDGEPILEHIVPRGEKKAGTAGE